MVWYLINFIISSKNIVSIENMDVSNYFT